MSVLSRTYRRDDAPLKVVSASARRVVGTAVDQKRAMQKPEELAAFVDFLSAIHPLANVLEIGGMYGGTTWLWDEIADAGHPPVVVIDKFVLDGRLEHAPDATLIRDDSHQSRVRDQIAEMVAERGLFDLLFIDGDHSYAGVRQDFWTYRPFVRSGGVVALHDTAVPHEDVAQHNVIPFWLEVCTQFVHVELFDPSVEWGGIGVLVMP